MPRVIIREQLADVRLAQRAEQGIRHCVQQRITIGVTNRPERMVDPFTAEHKRLAVAFRRVRLESMQIVPVTDANGLLHFWHVRSVPRNGSARRDRGLPGFGVLRVLRRERRVAGKHQSSFSLVDCSG